MSSLRKPEKLLTALMYEYSVEQGCRLEDVTMETSLWQERPDIDQKDGAHLLTGLTLVNANFDFEDKKLFPAQAKRYHQKIPFVKVKFGRNEGTEDIPRTKNRVYKCPVFETFNR